MTSLSTSTARGGLIAASVGILCLFQTLPVAAAETNAAPVKFDPPRSAFVDDPKVGRDPFFPRSPRRTERLPVASVASAPAQAAPAVSHFKLQGISGTTKRKLALINNRTFEVGEEGEVKTSEGKARIRCLQVKENSVVILIGGNQRREIFLGDAPETAAPDASSSAKLWN